MIVGTHAIFQEQVQFNGLALVIIDEQHRLAYISVWHCGRKASSRASIRIS